MNTKRYLVSWAAVFAFIFFFDFLVHGYLLMGIYEATSSLWRSPEESQMEFMFMSQILFAALFVFIFTRNFENKGPREGMRYGLLVGLLLASLEIGKYCYMPVPGTLIVYWMISSIVTCVVAGAIASLTYRE